MGSNMESEQRLPLVESNHNVASRHRSGVSSDSAQKTLRRTSQSTSCLYDSSDSNHRWRSDDSIFPAPVCSISQKLDELATTQTIVAGGASFEMLAAPSGIESNLITSVHYPHTLDPIIEQNSVSSLRHSTRLSLKQKRSIVSKLALRRSVNVLRQLAEARRRAAFSLTDLALFKTLSHFTDTPSSSQASFDPPAKVQPIVPPKSPLQRQITPPGVPTFNTREAHAYHLPRPQSLPGLPRPHQFHKHTPRALRKKFRERLAAHRAINEWSFQTQDLPRGAIMRGRDGTLVYGAWQPTQSGHTGHVSPPNRRGRTAGGGKVAAGTGMTVSELLRQYGLMGHSTTLPSTPSAPANIDLSQLQPAASPQMRPPTPVQPMGGRGMQRGMATSIPSPQSSRPSERQRMPIISFCCCWSLGGAGGGGEGASD